MSLIKQKKTHRYHQIAKNGKLKELRRELNSAQSSQLDDDSKVKLLNETDDENRTPLYYAVENGSVEMAGELLEHGAKPSLDDVLLVASKRNSGIDFY